MAQLVRVQILDREFALRVKDGSDAAVTRRLAADVEARLRQFQEDHPRQPELTAALITAMALAEELYDAQQQHKRAVEALEADADRMADALSEVLGEAEADPGESPDEAPSSSGL